MADRHTSYGHFGLGQHWLDRHTNTQRERERDMEIVSELNKMKERKRTFSVKPFHRR